MKERTDGTIEAGEAARRRWDAVVVGAGPAGSSAAIVLAQRGANVLLLDKRLFPRAKVCGCCVNAEAMAAIDSLGASRHLRDVGARAIRELRLYAGGFVARLALHGGVSVSRAAFDAALVRRAIEVGADFLPGVNARATTCDEHRRIVHIDDGELSTSALIAADGLAGRFVSQAGETVARHSWMGASCTIDVAPPGIAPGAIHMACGRGGYAGAVRLEDGRLDVAGALDPACVKRMGGPTAMVAALFARAGMPAIDALHDQQWKGTPLLTRRAAQLTAHRMLIAGDATGYVEPFTGDGIAWALRSGAAAGAFAARGVANWNPAIEAAWRREHGARFAWRRSRCQVITRLLRYPGLVVPAVAALSVLPMLAAPLTRWVNGRAVVVRGDV